MSQKVKCVELFAGEKSFSKEWQRQGGDAFTVEINPEQNPDLCKDVRYVTREDIPEEYLEPLVVWASIPCTKFSVASIGKHWKGNLPPESGVELVMHALRIIAILKPKYFVIENPRGMMRTLPIMAELPRRTVTYCQYGDDRMKPTDIWTNCYEWRPRPMCKNGDPCHAAAPRGSRTGTQGLKGNVERSVIPAELCREIAQAIMPKQKVLV